MRPAVRGFILVFLLCTVPAVSRAEPLAAYMTLPEFRKLAGDLSQKVSLFTDVWAANPSAEFFGGTSRDFLYWLLGKFHGVTSREEALAVEKELRALPAIDARDFIIGDSDVDIVSMQRLKLFPENYGVKKFDYIPDDRFNPSTEAGGTELNQGYIPAEKIRLTAKGLKDWDAMGNGVEEIFTGKLTVHFATPEQFESTYYAKRKLNHPVLLALRYLRLLAIDYAKRHGQAYPDTEALFRIDPQSAKAAAAVLRDAAVRGSLAPYLKEPQFLKWLNASITKAFTSYTNPTAAKLLFDRFGAAELVSLYPELEQYNQTLFRQSPDPQKVRDNWERFGVRARTFLVAPSALFPDGRLYHGARSDGAFRGILFQGVLPSEGGTAGRGLYGVSRHHLSFASGWAGTASRIVHFDVASTAKIVDITKGEGRRILEAYLAATPGGDEDSFAEAFGIDILRYPYKPQAFVVKNSAVLSRPQGENRELLTLSQLMERARALGSRDALEKFLRALRFSQLLPREVELLLATAAAQPGNVPLAAGTLLERALLASKAGKREDKASVATPSQALLQVTDEERAAADPIMSADWLSSIKPAEFRKARELLGYGPENLSELDLKAHSNTLKLWNHRDAGILTPGEWERAAGELCDRADRALLALSFSRGNDATGKRLFELWDLKADIPPRYFREDPALFHHVLTAFRAKNVFLNIGVWEWLRTYIAERNKDRAGAANALTQLRKALNDPDPAIRGGAGQLLMLMEKSNEAIELSVIHAFELGYFRDFFDAHGEIPPRFKTAAGQVALARLLAKTFRDSKKQTVFTNGVYNALQRIKKARPELFPVLNSLLDNDSALVRARAAGLLSKNGHATERSNRALIQVMRDVPKYRENVADILGDYPPKEEASRHELLKALSEMEIVSKSDFQKRKYTELLTPFSKRNALPPALRPLMEALAHHANAAVREAAAKALKANPTPAKCTTAVLAPRESQP